MDIEDLIILMFLILVIGGVGKCTVEIISDDENSFKEYVQERAEAERTANEEVLKKYAENTVKTIEQRIEILEDNNIDIPKRIALAVNGSEYGGEVPRQVHEFAKEHDMVIAFGQSDDLLELRGAIYDEIGAYEGGKFYYDVKEEEFLEDYMVDLDNPHNDRYINMVFSPRHIDATWSFDTNITGVEKFNIYEDGELYGEGLVIPLESVKPQSE